MESDRFKLLDGRPDDTRGDEEMGPGNPIPAFTGETCRSAEAHESGRSIGDVAVTPEGVVLDITDECLSRTGYCRADLLGRLIDTILDSASGAAIREFMQAPGHIHGAIVDAILVCRDGSTCGVELTVRCRTDVPGVFSIVINGFAEMTECRHRAMLTQVSVDKVSDMIIWLDADGRYVFVNRAATRMFGYSAAEFGRKRVWDVDPLFNEEIWREHWRDLVDRSVVRIETVNRTKDGVDVPIEVTANLVEYKGKFYNCSIVRDITERKRLEAEWRFLNEKALQLSLTDALTGIGNRRRFDTAFDAELKSHSRSHVPLSLILCDVDAFKAFNDRYGHVAGDDCLRQIAGVLSRAVQRSGDLAARFGGEEFACILPATELEGAMRVAEGIRTGIMALAIPHAGSPAAEMVTASLGVVTIRCLDNAPRPEILAAADAYLYEAKNKGRNRVVGGEFMRPGARHEKAGR